MKEIIINKFKNLDNQVKTVMFRGFQFALSFCIFAAIILAFYHYFYMEPMLYYIGTSLFKTSIMFFVDFVILGLGFDTIKKQMA